ncbi:endonuclease/exonuclease/phosphatase family protein [Vibrio alginolyticus]|uniref:endonuclease/exonuclease/phosphatase family protein n=1 Tax=Vibrio alginolyticus TaxID=663 RepID=UPI001BD42D5F|nr:endonuclease/exonuclease/phosphatase family protein [Vibrio alginolyticus]MBS9927341.1 endonuclease/exonuclease/phosphatase family protein [Vibrio alginolyticus]
MFLQKLKFGWWNVALSPSAKQAKSNSNDDNYKIVEKHINHLIKDEKCDLLALCEVSELDYFHFENTYGNEELGVINLTDEVGRTRFDMLVIYRKERLGVEQVNTLSKPVTGHTIKAAQVLKVTNLDIDTDEVFYLYTCHWASRLNGDSDKRRKKAASMVYSDALEYIEAGNHVIVMGDFNDNPYDVSINEELSASRCHDAVKRYPNEYLYNPFWRTVVSGLHYNRHNSSQSFRSGTHKYKEFAGTIWHSYDQIIVSGSLLSGDGWHLNESQTKVIEEVSLLRDFESRHSFLDHLPIVCEVNRI